MARNRFTKKISEIRKMLINMYELVDEAIRGVLPVLHNADLDKARILKNNDVRINAAEGHIFDLCANAIATEQPVARDLRRVIAAMKIVTDLERIGDYAANIAQQVTKSPNALTVVKEVNFAPMVEQGLLQLKGAIESYVSENAERAREVAEMDVKLDEMLHEITKNVVTGLSSSNEAEKESWLLVAIISRYLERLGDHATNICEWTIYSAEGKLIEL
jgi:phosphate transport system protein